jgi:polysaccharide export outer membrane protein
VAKISIKLVAVSLAVFLLLAIAPANVFAQKGSTGSAPAAPTPTADANGAVLPGQDRPALEHRNPRYQVGRDDILIVSFPLSPELNQIVTVQPDGYITLLNAGSLYVQGMTVPEVVGAMKKAYSKILHDPIIDVDLKDFQKPVFIVSGQVGKPGQYDLRYNTTVSQAVAIAGGFTPQAKTQVFVFHRVSSGWMEVKSLSLKDILN